MREQAIGAFVGSIVGAAVMYAVLYATQPPRLDEPILRALEAVSTPVPYEQIVETSVEISGRRLQIEGSYYVDHDARTFDSIATTTLTLLNGEPVGTFSIANRVIGEDIFTLVRSGEGSLVDSVPAGLWQHFRRGSIPAEFIDIATERPVLDNLVLFRGSGAYLTLIENHGVSRLNDTQLLKYTFRLSPIALDIPGGTMGAIVSRLGSEGTVQVWVNPINPQVHTVVLEAPSYRSTTTLQAIGEARTVQRPSI